MWLGMWLSNALQSVFLTPTRLFFALNTKTLSQIGARVNPRLGQKRFANASGRYAKPPRCPVLSPKLASGAPTRSSNERYRLVMGVCRG